VEDIALGVGLARLLGTLLFCAATVIGMRNYAVSAGITNYWMMFSVGMLAAAGSLFMATLESLHFVPDIHVLSPSLLTSAHTAILLSALDMLTSNIKRTAA
jgi:hypothetical protein